MDWVRPFYDRSRERWGPSGVLPHHQVRAKSLEALCGPGPKRVLELGCGAGGTAVALAALGHEVVALDLSPVSIAYAQELAQSKTYSGLLTVLEADFYTVELPGKFDVVGYWNGFGVGTDRDQRRLLARIAADWLAPEGVLLLDVFPPWSWMRKAGQEQRVDTDQGGTWIQRSDFDPVGCRFLDEWFPEGHEEQRLAQSIRCYTPSDLLLLLDGIGLKASAFYANDLESQNSDILVQGIHTMQHSLAEAWYYSVKILPES